MAVGHTIYIKYDFAKKFRNTKTDFFNSICNESGTEQQLATITSKLQGG